MLGIRVCNDGDINGEQASYATANSSFMSTQSNINCSTPNPNPSVDSLLSQIASLKKENEAKSEQIGELENKLYNIENEGLKFKESNNALLTKNSELLSQLQELRTEFGLLKIKVKSHEDDRSQGEDFAFGTQINDKGSARRKLFYDHPEADLEMERGALIAFGGDSDRIEDLESELSDALDKLSQYEDQINSYQVRIDEAEQEKKTADAKAVKFTRALQVRSYFVF